MGVQMFIYAAMPHTGSFQDACVIQAAYELNNSVLTHSLLSSSDPVSFIEISDSAIVLETLKKVFVYRLIFPCFTRSFIKAEGRDDALVLRLYESHGGSVTAHIKFNFRVKKARV
jgi:alpha-mannosidase